MAQPHPSCPCPSRPADTVGVHDCGVSQAIKRSFPSANEANAKGERYNSTYADLCITRQLAFDVRETQLALATSNFLSVYVFLHLTFDFCFICLVFVEFARKANFPGSRTACALPCR
jgi:hypothetical protein